jgi:hypothetical protein
MLSYCLHKTYLVAKLKHQEAEPPSTLASVLKPYQKQALFWMSKLEKGKDTHEATKTIDPCWSAYNISDKYVLFSVLCTIPHNAELLITLWL